MSDSEVIDESWRESLDFMKKQRLKPNGFINIGLSGYYLKVIEQLDDKCKELQSKLDEIEKQNFCALCYHQKNESSTCNRPDCECKAE